MFTSYFFMKVGPGNCLLRHAVRDAQARGETVLWVGYSSENIPDASAVADRQPPMNVRDLHYIAKVAADPEGRACTRILTFANETMYVWRAVGPLRNIAAHEIDSLMAEYGTDKHVHRQFGLPVRPTSSDKLRDELGCKALPVRLEKAVPRVLLPACIDSLSVHRFLNAGTFRYLYSANEALIPDDVLGHFLAPEYVPVRLTRAEWKESKFGCFVRKYLDWFLDETRDASFASTHGLSKADVFTLATSVMSPSQLETAASMFVHSIGMTLDAGIGKALDVIDVRASIRHRVRDPGYSRQLANVKDALACVMGGTVDPAVLRALDELGSLVIQCKNYELEVDTLEHPHVVVFSPRGTAGGRCITMASVRAFMEQRPGELEAFRDWMTLVQFSYQEPKSVLGIC